METEKPVPKRGKESLILGFSMFAMGGCGLAYEYTFSKTASDLLGNSARQWAIIIGVMLFFMGVGADVQKYVKDRGLIDKLLLSELLLGFLGGFGPIALLFAYSHFASHFVLVQYFFISAIGLLIGFEIPLITRINENYSEDLRINLGRILKMDYIGSLCGALVWIFILPHFFTMVEAAFVLSFFTTGVAFLGLFYFRRMLVFFPGVLVAGLVSVTALGFAFTRAGDWTSYAEQYLFIDRIVFSETSKYQHIVLTESPQGEIACYINGRLQFNSTDEHIYHEMLVHPAMELVQRRRKILVLGGGDGLAIREILKYGDVESVLLVDIDPMITDLASQNSYFTALNQHSLSDSRTRVMKNRALIGIGKEKIDVLNQNFPRDGRIGSVAEVHILNADAAKYIEQIPGRFDVVILDFPDPNSPELAKLYSLQFYQLLKSKLAKDGLFVQQSSSPVHTREAFLCIGRTMEQAGFAVLPYRENVPSFGEWGWWIGGHADRWTRERLQNQFQGIDSLSVETRYLTAELMRASRYFGRLQLTSNHLDVSTITSPRVYDYYLRAWESED